MVGDVGLVYLSGYYILFDVIYCSGEIVDGLGNSFSEYVVFGFEGEIDIEKGDCILLILCYILKVGVSWKLVVMLMFSVDMIVVLGVFVCGNENNDYEFDGVYYFGEGKIDVYVVINFGVEICLVC